MRAAAEWLNIAYRTNAKDLPGSPDLVFDERRKAVLVHGCFWHTHEACSTWKTVERLAKTSEFWREKFARNALRDEATLFSLRSRGFEVLVVWECETGDERGLVSRLAEFLGCEEETSGWRSFAGERSS